MGSCLRAAPNNAHNKRKTSPHKVGAGGLSYLMTWRGSSSSDRLKPVLCVSHVDVVPVPPDRVQVCGCVV